MKMNQQQWLLHLRKSMIWFIIHGLAPEGT